LKQYIESKSYAVGDSEHNILIMDNTKVTGDMVIVVMKRNVILIEIDQASVLASELNVSELALTIGNLTGIDASNILIELEVDEQGYVIRVIVMLNDVDECEQVIAAVNDLDECESTPVLCHSHARLVVDDVSISSATRDYIPYIRFPFIFFLLFALFFGK